MGAVPPGGPSTALAVGAALLLVVIIAGAAGTDRHRTRRGRRSRHATVTRPSRAVVVGVIVLGLVLGATVTGGAVARAVVAAVVAVGGALLRVFR